MLWYGVRLVRVVYALTNATVHTAAERGTVEGGVLIDGDEIRSVGDIAVPDGAFHSVDSMTSHVFVDGEHVFDRERDATDPREEWRRYR